MDLHRILQRIEREIEARETTAAEVSRRAGRDDIVRVFQRAVRQGRAVNVSTLEAIAAGLGVSEAWLLFGAEPLPNADLEARAAELERTLAGLKAAAASFLDSIGLEAAQDFVDSLEEIARMSATSTRDGPQLHDLQQQARGLSVPAARQLRTRPS